MLSLGLSWIQILLLALVAFAFILVKGFNHRLHQYLERHWVIDAIYDGLMWVPLWLIANEYFEWYVSAILVLGCMFMVEQLIRRNRMR